MSSTASFTRQFHSVLWIGALLLVSGSAWANPNPDIPTPMEVLRLPKYCQGQFIDNVKNIPGYKIGNCGVFMNHYCYGLNFLNRASDFSASKGARQWNANRARTDIAYTKDHMTATCPIAGDVRAAEMRLRTIEKFVK
jgi:hypothetical protein